ncbi:hypothetical protein PYW07_012130 [Mythimna separata]|uniref:Uncharacterized protein n=1 Tax=Mythimna separata TaxID=271217 RepID=A0AAD8DS57_MYTSE|nr:hypothetical protein PYW07_012130 [Mythimna separata]
MSTIKFCINGKPYEVDCTFGPDVSLSEYIRTVAELRGTKVMCYEGGCGSCIVTVRAAFAPDNVTKTFAVNSCLVSVLSCHGWEVTTVEGIGNRIKGYHDIQTRLAKFNGTQCGYCTPGWIMNMYSLYEAKNGSLTLEEIENSFAGNMCRCTGYRPIADAFKSFAKDADQRLLDKLCDLEDLDIIKPCGLECAQMCTHRNKCFKNNAENKNGTEKYDEKNSDEDDNDFIHIQDDEKMMIVDTQTHKWYRAYSLTDVFKCMSLGDYKLIAGNTGQGVYPVSDYPTNVIDIFNVAEIKGYTIDVNLILGAGMTLSEMMELFLKLAAEKEEFTYLKQFYKHMDLVAHIPVRNKLPGVIAFYTAKDIPGENTFTPKNFYGLVEKEELLCDKQVKFYGQPAAIIVADREKTANKAARLVKVRYSSVSKNKPLLTIDQVLKSPEKNKRVRTDQTIEPTEVGNDVKTVITGEMRIGEQYHYHIETQACVTKPTEDGMEVLSSTQWLDVTNVAIARVLKVPDNSINIVVRRLGGAFGAKLTRSAQVACSAALVTHLLNKTCRMILPLPTNMQAMGKRPPAMCNFEIGVNGEGKIQYLKNTLYQDGGISYNETYTPQTIAFLPNCYDSKRWYISGNSVLTDKAGTTFCRAPAAKKACEIINERLQPIKDRMNNPSWEELIAEAYDNYVYLQASYAFDPHDVKNYNLYAVTLMEVEVDILTGNHDIKRVDVLQDTGRSLSPEIDIGQIEGALIMGLGYWTAEKTVYDSSTGKLLTNRTWNYKIPGIKDIPSDMRIYLRRNAKNEFGVLQSKATGEPSVCLATVFLHAAREAVRSARLDAGYDDVWFDIDIPCTVENIFMAVGHKLEHFKLK